MDTTAIFERLKKDDLHQNHKGACVICTRPFTTCSHDIGDIARVLKEYKAQKQN